MPVIQRLLGRTRRASGGCLEWSGYRQPGGYGIISVDGRLWLVHRLMWVLVNGPIPEGLGVCHSCDNPPCCEPEHLFLGTQADNMADAVSKGRVDYTDVSRKGNAAQTFETRSAAAKKREAAKTPEARSEAARKANAAQRAARRRREATC